MGQFGPTMGELMLEDAIKRARWQKLRNGAYLICALAVALAALKFLFT